MTKRVTSLNLTAEDAANLSGENGEVLAFAIDMVIRAGEALGAQKLIDVSFAHIDACHYYGQVHLDFARYIVDGGGRVAVPSWTNTVPANPQDPDLRPPGKSSEFLTGAHQILGLYREMGCNPVWTCAPYQLPGGPEFGDHIIGSESNAVTYYNSVTGARTNKYGDFLDVCAALTGRAPYAGLHVTENRRGTQIFELADDVPEALRGEEEFAHVLGHHIGRNCGGGIPVISGLSAHIAEDSLKAISAALAASGGVQMFHGVGITPEAKTLHAALQGDQAGPATILNLENLRAARENLSSAHSGVLDMVALGTPHFSFTEFSRLVHLVEGTRISNDLVAYISTSRHVLALIDAKGWKEKIERAGWRIIVDTCTYFGPAVSGCSGQVMTNSAKWAYYAPGLLGVSVAFGSLQDCVNSAIAGKIIRDDSPWTRSSS